VALLVEIYLPYKYRDITSREIGVKGRIDGRTIGGTIKVHNTSAAQQQPMQKTQKNVCVLVTSPQCIR